MEEEGYDLFPNERKKILDFISKKNIKGVVFITGDRHFTELQKLERKDQYSLYDFTCSPMTIFLGKPRLNEDKSPLKVSGTHVHHRNFGKISVIGDKGSRSCVIEVYDDKSRFLWKHIIRENELK